MQPSETSFIHIIRSITLLATLTFVPGIAIFWNLLSDNVKNTSAPRPASLKANETQIDHKDSSESTTSFREIVPAISSPAPRVASELPVQQPTWDWNSSQTRPFQPVPPQDVTSLEFRLQALGATNCQLAPWGNQGKLFRFSCYVIPSEPYAYRKHFQAIGADALTVMQSVIADIEHWKNGQAHSVR